MQASLPTDAQIVVDARVLKRAPTGLANHLLGLLGGIRELRADLSLVAAAWGVRDIHPAARLPTGVGWRRGFLGGPIPPSVLWDSPFARLGAWDRAFSRAQLFHSPVGDPIPSRRCPSTATVHDLSTLNPQWHEHHVSGRYTAERMARQLRGAAHVFTVSEAIRAELSDRIGVGRERISVLYNAPSPGMDLPGDVEQTRRARERHGISRPYLLSVGTIEVRKNHARLIDGFMDAVQADPSLEHELLLIGQWGWMVDGVRERLERPEVKRRVRHLGYVTTDDLRALYDGAAATAYVSVYEGFGMPVLDSLARGVQVVHSSDPAVVEVAGGVGIQVDERDVHSIAAGVHRALSGSFDGTALKRRAAHFTWRNTAAAFLDVAGRLARG